MKKTFFFTLMLCISTPLLADTDEQKEEFQSDETIETGILYDLTNKLIDKTSDKKTNDPETEGKMVYGEKTTKWASMPKFGGYFIGKFAYDSHEDTKTNFSQRLIRAYVDGTILKDFKYRIQIQCNNASFHMKDVFVEWGHFKELKVKIGQYKRAFGFENPMNPWDVGVGDYSQLTKELTGHSDTYVGENSSNGGRDQGIQLQGDLFRIGKDKHSLIHYQVMLSNGQGINTGDQNSNKDVNFTLQFQPIKGLTIGGFGWIGKYYNSTRKITYDRKRWIVGATFDKYNWLARAEYGHSQEGRDAWYATVGIPCTKWLRTWVKWDVLRTDTGNKFDSSKSIYSIAPSFRLHKNLMFQLQYNYVVDKTTDSNYSQIWVETYFRF